MTEPDLHSLRPSQPAGPVLCMLGGLFVEIDGTRLEIPDGSKRLVAYLAVHDGWAERRTVAGVLWPLGNDTRAAGNLRSAVWRLRGSGIDLIDGDRRRLRLKSDVVVDSHLVADWAARLIEGAASASDIAVRACSPALVDLLPGSFEEWAVFERERLRQRVLHGLEALSRHLRGLRRTAEAIETAAGVVAIDPLRESAQRALVEAHLAAGNTGAAKRILQCYRRLVLRELNAFPSSEFVRLVAEAADDGLVPALCIGG
jgi:DNA-binding SARP family transcriptional activator